MSGERSYTLQISHAVCKSALPPHLRHLLLTLSLLADSRTGTGYYGQLYIAGAMGVSDKTLRKYFAELEALDQRGASPVRLTREHQGRPDGTGRSSDKWTLVAVVSQTSNGSGVPVEVGVDDAAQTEEIGVSNGSQCSEDRRDRSSAAKTANDSPLGEHNIAGWDQQLEYMRLCKVDAGRR